MEDKSKTKFDWQHSWLPNGTPEQRIARRVCAWQPWCSPQFYCRRSTSRRPKPVGSLLFATRSTQRIPRHSQLLAGGLLKNLLRTMPNLCNCLCVKMPGVPVWRARSFDVFDVLVMNTWNHHVSGYGAELDQSRQCCMLCEGQYCVRCSSAHEDKQIRPFASTCTVETVLWFGVCDVQNFQAGANSNSADRDGVTPLFWACYAGNADMMRSLLEHGANVNVVDKSTGYTPLFLTALYGHTEATQVLLTNQASLHVVDNIGRTPLMLAASGGRQDTVRVLLLHGANPARVDAEGLSCIDHAHLGSHDIVVDQLMKFRTRRVSLPLCSTYDVSSPSRQVQLSSSDNWEKSQQVLYCCLNREIVCDIFVRLTMFKQLVNLRSDMWSSSQPDKHEDILYRVCELSSEPWLESTYASYVNSTCCFKHILSWQVQIIRVGSIAQNILHPFCSEWLCFSVLQEDL